jgi:hypothetical protein
LESADARTDGADPDHAGFARAAREQSHQPRFARDEPIVHGVDRGRMHAQQHFAIAGYRHGYVDQAKYLQGRAELRVLDGTHDSPPACCVFSVATA